MVDSSRPDLPPSGDRQVPRGVDPHAAHRWRARMARAPQPPWLHTELASRMAQRLPIIRRAPGRALLWPQTSASAASLVLAVWPRCECWGIAEQPVDRPEPVLTWWQRCMGWLISRGSNATASQSIGVDHITPASVDMVWSHLHVHTHPSPPDLMRQWLRALTVEGFLMFSTWGPGSLPELRALYGRRGLGPAMAEWVDMHDWGDLLVQVGFADPVMDQETLTLTFSTPEAALAELRALGGNTHPLRFPGLRTRRWRDCLLEDLRELGRQRADGRIPLSFEVVYGHAFKPQARFAVSAETRVDAEQLRQAARAARSVPGASAT